MKGLQKPRSVEVLTSAKEKWGSRQVQALTMAYGRKMFRETDMRRGKKLIWSLFLYMQLMGLPENL